MAHFAQLDENNTVTNVIVISNNDILDENGQESETVGINFCKTLFGEDTVWVQTSYNNSFRVKYAGIGDKWDSELARFIPPKPFASWIYNSDLNIWDAPVQLPADDTRLWEWNEDILNWEDKTPVIPE